jgi:hypothetical protein
MCGSGAATGGDFRHTLRETNSDFAAVVQLRVLTLEGYLRERRFRDEQPHSLALGRHKTLCTRAALQQLAR